MTDLYKMLEQLHEVAVEQPRSLGPIFWRVERDEISMQIAKIKASLPKEVKTAEHVAREKDRIVEASNAEAKKLVDSARAEAAKLLEEAQKERETILEDARKQQTELVAESQILHIAKAQAEEVRLAAERDAAQTRRSAEDYAYTILSKIESLNQKIGLAIAGGKEEIRRAELQPSLAIAPEREKVRLS
jgi:DNA polymerase II small subunit/DNA polymerase delta subunit B